MNPQSAKSNIAYAAAACAGNGLIGAAPARESHVPEEVGALRQSVNELCAEFDALAARLSCVTAPMPGEAVGEQALDSYRVPLADNIRTERRRVQGVIDAVRRLNMALEV